MSTVEETLRNVSRRSRHGTRGSGSSTRADWSASVVRGPAQPTPVAAPAATSTAFARPQDITGPTRRQSSRDSVDSAGQHTPPDHADLLFKVLPCPLIPLFLLLAHLMTTIRVGICCFSYFFLACQARGTQFFGRNRFFRVKRAILFIFILFYLLFLFIILI